MKNYFTSQHFVDNLNRIDKIKNAPAIAEVAKNLNKGRYKDTPELEVALRNFLK